MTLKVLIFPVLVGTVIPESVIYSYGTILIDLLSGKHIPPSHVMCPTTFLVSFHSFVSFAENLRNVQYQALDIIRDKNVLVLMDSTLEERYEIENAAKLVDLASKCLQPEPKDRPDTKFLLSSAAQLQKQKEVFKNQIYINNTQYFPWQI